MFVLVLIPSWLSEEKASSGMHNRGGGPSEMDKRNERQLWVDVPGDDDAVIFIGVDQNTHGLHIMYLQAAGMTKNAST